MISSDDSALLDLLRLLHRESYRFVAPTPASHARVLARPDRNQARTLRDVLGWSLPFATGDVDAPIEELLRKSGVLVETKAGLLVSKLRVSSLRGGLFLHSAYPTDHKDAVFFGPDSYRFADLIVAELACSPLAPGAHIVDVGAGSGVGGIVAALSSEQSRVTLVDLNPKALRLARINAAAAGVAVETMVAADLSSLTDPIDLAVINPPYIIDDASRAYRDGGGMHGGEVALEMTRMAAERLAPGGRLILYTGAAIVDGQNALCDAIGDLAGRRALNFSCREIDPDVFGEELEKPAYADVERIALVAVILARTCHHKDPLVPSVVEGRSSQAGARAPRLRALRFARDERHVDSVG